MWFRPKAPASLADLGLSDEDCAALRAWIGRATPDTVDGIWQFIGRDPDAGCDPPRDSGLNRQAFLRALLIAAQREAEETSGPRAWHPVRRFLRRHWVEMAVLTLLLVIAGGVVRVGGVMRGSWQFGLSRRVVAARPLAAGREISRDDIRVAYLPGATEGTPDLVRLLSRRPLQAIPAGRVIPLSGLQARQVMTRSAIAAGEPIRPDGVRLDWSADVPGAFTSPGRVVGQCARQALQANSVMMSESVMACPPSPPRATPPSPR
jgi:hypothetical protein